VQTKTGKQWQLTQAKQYTLQPFFEPNTSVLIQGSLHTQLPLNKTHKSILFLKNPIQLFLHEKREQKKRM
jgi:hypothetical protein